MLKEAKPSKSQRRFESDILSIPADRVKEMVAGVSQEVPIAVANAYQAAAWVLKVDAFRSVEESFMVDGRYEAALPDHRVILADMIADGEATIQAARKHGLPVRPEIFTLADLEATLDGLHRTFRCEHGPKNSQTTNALISQLFDGPKSGD